MGVITLVGIAVAIKPKHNIDLATLHKYRKKTYVLVLLSREKKWFKKRIEGGVVVVVVVVVGVVVVVVVGVVVVVVVLFSVVVVVVVLFSVVVVVGVVVVVEVVGVVVVVVVAAQVARELVSTNWTEPGTRVAFESATQAPKEITVSVTEQLTHPDAQPQLRVRFVAVTAVML